MAPKDTIVRARSSITNSVPEEKPKTAASILQYWSATEIRGNAILTYPASVNNCQGESRELLVSENNTQCTRNIPMHLRHTTLSIDVLKPFHNLLPKMPHSSHYMETSDLSTTRKMTANIGRWVYPQHIAEALTTERICQSPLPPLHAPGSYHGLRHNEHPSSGKGIDHLVVSWAEIRPRRWKNQYLPYQKWSWSLVDAAFFLSTVFWAPIFLVL